MLTEDVVDINTPILDEIQDTHERTEANTIMIPEDHTQSKMPVIVPILGNIDAVQGHINEDDV